MWTGLFVGSLEGELQRLSNLCHVPCLTEPRWGKDLICPPPPQYFQTTLERIWSTKTLSTCQPLAGLLLNVHLWWNKIIKINGNGTKTQLTNYNIIFQLPTIIFPNAGLRVFKVEGKKHHWSSSIGANHPLGKLAIVERKLQLWILPC